ncbi:hypothetical protein [Cytobacillus kochii]|uniref:hypothetical protein n=1 Tax=Cytobacillus kochii TaxID=859143 RepID=UPI0024813A74|nr:hypothetical protein [Cytobacillus kochii]
MTKKSGYIPGQGRTFTPSLNGNWTEEFNKILEKENLSRNSLTEALIEMGLKVKRNDHLFISTEDLTSDQIEILSSNEGQKILLNVALMLSGHANNLINFSEKPDNSQAKKVESKGKSKNEEVAEESAHNRALQMMNMLNKSIQN